MLRRVGRFLRIGQIMAMVCPMPLLASVPMDYFKQHVSNTLDKGEDAFVFQTKECHALVLADSNSNVGAILVHTKKRKQQAEDLVEQLIKIAPTEGDSQVLYSADGCSALVLYHPDYKQKGVLSYNRLSAIQYIFAKEEYGTWTPHRWHDSGISFRCHYRKSLRIEVTIPMDEEFVRYAEIRIKPDFAKKNVYSVLGLDARDSNSNEEKELARRFRHQEIIHADNFNNVYIVYGFGVFFAGTKELVFVKTRARNDVNDYFFAEDVYPSKPAVIRVPYTKPVVKPVKKPEEKLKDEPKPVEEKKEPVKVYTPEEARKAYIDYLKSLRG